MNRLLILIGCVFPAVLFAQSERFTPGKSVPPGMVLINDTLCLDQYPVDHRMIGEMIENVEWVTGLQKKSEKQKNKLIKSTFGDFGPYAYQASLPFMPLLEEMKQLNEKYLRQVLYEDNWLPYSRNLLFSENPIVFPNTPKGRKDLQRLAEIYAAWRSKAVLAKMKYQNPRKQFNEQKDIFTVAELRHWSAPVLKNTESLFLHIPLKEQKVTKAIRIFTFREMTELSHGNIHSNQSQGRGWIGFRCASEINQKKDSSF